MTTNKDENGLLPCPFCGEQAKLWNDGKVSCSNPSCGCWKSHLQENATPFWRDSWNTRAQPQTADAKEALDALNDAEECFQPETLEELRKHFNTIRDALTAQQPDVAGILNYKYIDKLIDEHLIVNPDTMTYDLDRGNIQWFISKVLECEIVTDENFTKVASKKMMDLAELFGNFTTIADNIDQEAWNHLLVYHPCANNPNKILPIKVDGEKTPYEKGFDDCLRKFCIKNTTAESVAELQDFACKISECVWGGELGWKKAGLDKLADEVKRRMKQPDVNAELLWALKYARRFLTPEHHDTAFIDKAIDRAEQKGGIK